MNVLFVCSLSIEQREATNCYFQSLLIILWLIELIELIRPVVAMPPPSHSTNLTFITHSQGYLHPKNLFNKMRCIFFKAPRGIFSQKTSVAYQHNWGVMSIITWLIDELLDRRLIRNNFLISECLFSESYMTVNRPATTQGGILFGESDVAT